MNTTNTTNATNAIARVNNDLLSYLKGAEVGMAIVAINLRGAADIDGELQGMAEVVGTIRGLMVELIEDLVEKMDADQAVEDGMAEADLSAVAEALRRTFDGEILPKTEEDQAIEAWDAEESDRQEAEAYAEAEANMREAAGAAVMEAMRGDSDEFASEEAARIKASDEAVVENMRQRLLENAEWAAVNPELANHGFIAKVLWVGSWRPDYNEAANITRGIPGAVWVEFEEASEVEFQDNPNPVLDMVNEAMKRGCDTIAGEWSIEMAIRIGRFNKAGDGDLLGVRIAFPCGRKHGNWKFTIV